MNSNEVRTRFLSWLDRQVLHAGRGDDVDTLEVAPSGRFWLGRLAPEDLVVNLGLGERGERLDPCAVGLVLRPAESLPLRFSIDVRCLAWIRESNEAWRKTPKAHVRIDLVVESVGETTHGAEAIAAALGSVTGNEVLTGEVRIEVLRGFDDRLELAIEFVNTSPEAEGRRQDTNLYECELEVRGLATLPFLLEALPDSFRYDRRIEAYGINCGVKVSNGVFKTTDTIEVDRGRPSYWNVAESTPDLSFERLASEPLTSLDALVSCHRRWGDSIWGPQVLAARAVEQGWSPSMRQEAEQEAAKFRQEEERLALGISSLRQDSKLLRAFQLMNEAMLHAVRHSEWRPFQVGFLLANLRCIIDPPAENSVADIVWFATGGGKTETYLGLLITAALFDRMTGKLSGVTAWSRFPLRMLSLQQTQRFANAMAGAELVRRKHKIDGNAFSVGFLVGDGATPNRIPAQPGKGDQDKDPEDPGMPDRYKVLSSCPFCHHTSIHMAFNRRQWCLEHRCTNAECQWNESALPFFIVDEEIYRFLPTVVVGTLDKAASIALQAAMRGLVGPPLGRCSVAGHGYLYAPRNKRPTGCLVPGCRGKAGPLEQEPGRFGPSFRLQDELHLLKDSLGAVDAHYEALLDHLQLKLTGAAPKILGSSATLTGYQKQVDVLYRRTGRVFPLQGPSASEGFWTRESDELARRFVGVAPRGLTIEYAVDRMVTELQRAVRKLRDEPRQICAEIDIPLETADELLSIYGTNVVYGNTLRDLDAATRSLETQVPVDGTLNTATLTGRTDFDEVRQVLARLDHPEQAFDDRIHVVSASSMMSHGVDIDRLNTMVVLGLPLTTAEFIQATARVGRRYPGLVYVIHKIARERDASVYRAFEPFVRQGDRFVEAIPITRRSRKVLDRTMAGLELARILAIHEPASRTSLATVRALRQHWKDAKVTSESETRALIEALQLDDAMDERLREDVKRWIERFFHNLMDPAGTITFPNELCPGNRPMTSLRDVEEQVPILGILR